MFRLTLPVLRVLAIPVVALVILSSCSVGGDVSESDAPARTPSGPAREVTQAPRQQSSLDCLPEANDRGFYTFEEYTQATRCVAPLFTWPDGYYPNLDALHDIYADDAEGGWQQGLEWVNGMGWNRCAWYLTWLDARTSGDTATERDALDVMQTVIYDDYDAAMPAMPKGLTAQSEDTLTKRQIDAAALGDPSLIQQEAELCRNIPWLDGPPQ